MSEISKSSDRALVFIDASVRESDTLVAGLATGSEVVFLDPTQDGVQQIGEAINRLSTRGAIVEQPRLSALHIVSHGSPGSIQLGNTKLSQDNLDAYATQLQQWKNALTPNADILFYGCDVARNLSNDEISSPSFLSRISHLTGADIAASNDKTGRGGDWQLEVTTGTIETPQAFSPGAVANYRRTLASPVANNDRTTTAAIAPVTLNVLANDTDADADYVQVASIVTAPSHGTATIQEDVYVVGNFTDAGGNPNADRIAKWDGVTWTALGNGLNSLVYDLAISGSNIYAGGVFTDAGGNPNSDRIAMWDGITWSNLGGGLNNNVHKIGVNGSNVYAAGRFTEAGGNAAANRIAMWDGTTWSPLNSGLNNDVYGMAISGSNVYAGGRFPSVGGNATANRIAQWDGTAWSPINSGLNNDVIDIATANSTVYAGGYFLDAGGNPNADRIAMWDGTSWSPLGSGLNNYVFAIAISGSNVYAGGNFTDAGGNPNANRIAKWDGTTWSNLGGGLNSIVRGIAISGSNVYVGGNFTDAGGNPNADRIAKWDGTTWSDLGGGLNADVEAIAIDPGRNIVYTPDPEFIGIDTFQYQISDGSTTSTAIAAVKVGNRAPTVQKDTTVNVGYEGPATNLNITDPTDSDNTDVLGFTFDTLTIAVASLPTQGEIRKADSTLVTPDTPLTATDFAGLTFTPTPGATGEAGTFSYQVSDGTATSTQTVTLNIGAPSAVSFGAATYSSTEDSSDTIVNIPVTLSGIPSSPVTVPIILSGTATEGTDYTVSPTTLNFTADPTRAPLTQNITLTIKPDNIPENAETVILGLGSITGGLTGSIPTTSVTIDANDPINYGLAVDSTAIAEGNKGTTPINFTVTRSGGIDIPSTLEYSIRGTADSSDYNISGGAPISGTLNFAANETTKTLTLNLNGDLAVEPNENIQFSLSNPNLTAPLENSTIANATAAVDITNDDAAGVLIDSTSTTAVEGGATEAHNRDRNSAGVSIIQSLSSTNVLEGFSFASYKVALTQQPNSDVAIAITTDGQTATERSNFIFTANNWNIPQTLTVAAVDDSIAEGSHHSSIRHVASSSDRLYNNQFAIATINLSDNDNPGQVMNLSKRSVIAMTDADDKITGSISNDILQGLAGNDKIEGLAGNDFLYGLLGDDGIACGEGNDVGFGGEGNDEITGNAGSDVAYGGEGSDRVRGGDGTDRLFGDAGNDHLLGDAGSDTLTGGAAIDAFAIGAGTGGTLLTAADLITDFTPDLDRIDLIGTLSFSQLNIFQRTNSFTEDTIIQNQGTGEYLAVLTGVLPSILDPTNFV